MINKIVIFLIRHYYTTVNMRRILVKHIIADLPEMARKEIVASLLPAGKHIHGNPKRAVAGDGRQGRETLTP